MMAKSIDNYINEQFSQEDATVVKKALRAAIFPLIGEDEERWRVQVAIIIVSESRLDFFHQALRYALNDWRDVLITAGLANENWRSVAQQLGYERKTDGAIERWKKWGVHLLRDGTCFLRRLIQR